jgi:hypothetical protein
MQVHAGIIGSIGGAYIGMSYLLGRGHALAVSLAIALFVIGVSCLSSDLRMLRRNLAQ